MPDKIRKEYNKYESFKWQSSDQSWRFEEERCTKERQVVAGVEAVPECTEEEHDGDTTPALIDDVAQPDHRWHVPMIQHLFHAGTQLQTHHSISYLYRDDAPSNRYKKAELTLVLARDRAATWRLILNLDSSQAATERLTCGAATWRKC